MRLWLVVLALCGSAAAQSTGRIEGRVVSQNGEPIRKATVRFQGVGPLPNGVQPTSYIELTDSAGRFVVEGLPPGRYQGSASRTGFTPPRTNNGAANSVITLQPADVKTGVEFKLVPLGIITGQVTDQDGDPVFGVTVQAMRFQYSSTGRQLSINAAATTDDQGNFRILNVQPGRYYPMADDVRSRSGSANTERRGRSAQQVDVTTFYPGSPELNGAAPIDVGPGAEVRGVNIRMVKGRVFTIRGKAIDSRTGAPVAEQLLLTRQGAEKGLAGSQFNSAAQSQNGTFEFHGVEAGTYVLRGQPQQRSVQINGSPNNSNLAGRMDITVSDSDVDGLVFPLSTALEITGTIRVEDGNLQTLVQPPYASLDPVSRSAIGGGLRIVLMSSEGTAVTVPIDTNGAFKMANLGWSQYTVNFQQQQQALYIKAMRFGGQDALKSPLDLTSGAGGVLDILLSPKAAEVDASVHSNGNPAPGAFVTIWSKVSSILDPMRGRAFRSGQDGSVKLTGIPPGEYYVAAWEDVDQSLLGYLDFLAHFTDLATTVRVSESDRTAIDLTLISKEKIAAEVAKLP